jgi:hypothetical protein
MNRTTNYSNNLDLQRQRFEQLMQETGHRPAEQKSVFATALTYLGDTIMRFLTSNNELRIWQRTRNGRSTWFAYDPVTDRKRQFYSEQEVRLWLDNRYYE